MIRCTIELLPGGNESRARTIVEGEDEDAIAARVAGHHRSRRGSYDLLYRALKACGLESRVPVADRG